MPPERRPAREAYARRQKRIDDAIALRRPDRTPVFYHSMFWHAARAGISFREAMYDYGKLTAATRKAVLALQPDAYVLPHAMVALGPAMEALDYRPLRWPGRGVGDYASYQYIDREYMTAAEYDDYIFDPTGYLLGTYLPRICGGLEALRYWPDLPGASYLHFILATRAFADPALSKALGSLTAAGNEMRSALRQGMSMVDDLAARGFPLAQSAAALAPYDYFADNMRGSKGAMLDMFRTPGKLLTAMDKAEVVIARHAIAQASRSPCKIVFIPIHWGLDGFMSPEQFKTFFWPPLRRVMMKLIEAGLTPCPLWEGDVTSRLEIIADIPPGKCIYWFERTDLFLAKAVLGGIACIRGNVPASLLTAGTPDEVRAYCRRLIEGIGKDGGFILDGAIGIPDEARPANVKAMYETAHQSG